MSERNFSMRMHCTYEGDTNTVAGIDVEHQVEGQWQPLELALTAPGFDIFVYAVFTCQHLYFRTNCAERGLVLSKAEGSIAVGADAEWGMDTLRVHFSGQLGSGQASQDDIDYIVGRMKQCPVSHNLRDVPDASTSIGLS